MVRKAIVTFCSVSLHQAKLPPSLFLNSNNNKNKLFKYIVIVDVISAHEQSSEEQVPDEVNSNVQCQPT